MPMLTRIAKPSLAYQYLPGIKNVGVYFLPGYNSSMRGPKSKALFDWCKLNGHEFTTFDYRGTSESDGPVGSLNNWIGDATDVLKTITRKPVIIVGSSLGGLIMLHIAAKNPEKVKGMVGVAPLIDFCEEPLYKQLNDLKLFTINKPKYDLPCNFFAFHGIDDEAIPWKNSFDAFHTKFNENGFTSLFTLCKNKGHRLNAYEDLNLMISYVEQLIKLNEQLVESKV